MESLNVKTEVANVSMDANGIILVKINSFAVVDTEDVLDINLVVRSLSNNQPVLKLIDARTNWKIVPSAKEFALEQDASNKTIARAIVVPSRLKSTLYTFYRQFHKSKYPQRYFWDYDTAYNWLLKLKESA